MKSNLLLFTATYPFRSYTEEVFVTSELEALADRFDRVIVVPQVRRGDMIAVGHPRVEVDLSMAGSPYVRVNLLKLPWMLHPYALSRLPKLLREARSPRKLLSGWLFAMNTALCSRIIARIVRRHGLSPDNTLVYTYWFDHIPSAVLRLGRSGEGFAVVTRAHGFDVFDDQVAFRSHELRSEALAGLKRVVTASENGRSYLLNHYPGCSAEIEARPLGSVKPVDETLTSSCHTPDEGCWTFFTCARVSPEKRVAKALEFVRAVAAAYPFKQIKWIHVGDGPAISDLRRRASRRDSLPTNLSVDLRGSLPNEEVHRIYLNEPVDWFLLLSSSEGGLPVSVCEALSYGVPVIASDVGGLPEIVTPEVGMTFPVDAEPERMVGELQPYFNSYSDYLTLRDGALLRWREMFSASARSRRFADELSNDF